MKETHRAVRCAVLAGPQGAGKTTLLRALSERAAANAPSADTAPEARDFGMTTEPNVARFDYLDETWNVIDTPGSTELLQSAYDMMAAADIVILVAEPDPERAISLSPYFKFLDDRAIPHGVFVNRLDERRFRARDLLQALQTYSERPLILRQVPIREKDQIVGAVDLVSERAWKYREGASSELIEIPETAKARENEEREAMLDVLADFDDVLMEQILEDKVPPSSAIFEVMTRELESDLVAPVMLGSAAHGNGVTRLLKMLRHDAPGVERAAERYGLNGAGKTVASVIRTSYAPHVGKTSALRIWKGELRDGDTLNGARISGLAALGDGTRAKLAAAGPGDLVALPRFDGIATGDLIIDGKSSKGDVKAEPLAPVYALAIRPKNEKDDVKLSTALAKLCEEDASLTTERRIDTNEFILKGQGDMHLRLAAAKLKNQHNVEFNASTPRASYRETITASADHHARHKKQSGGHGQFADIKIKIKPLPRGSGFEFNETIHGGSVPKQFIPAVEAGVTEGLETGPLGFPVTDLAVTLVDGQHHPVDSNELSFKLAGRQAMRDALGDCSPVLLEPIYKTEIHAPREHVNKVHGVVSSRRGQILGFDARPGWPGWDSVSAMMPESGLEDLIIELRSLTQGAATFEARFDHYQELYGKDAEQIVLRRKAELEAR